MEGLSRGFTSAAIKLLVGGWLAKSASKEVGKIWKVDDELRKLQITLSRIMAIIEQVEHDHWLCFSSDSIKKAWQLWLDDVKSLSCVANNLLDDISIELDRPPNSKVDDSHKSESDDSQPTFTDDPHALGSEVLTTGKLDVSGRVFKLRQQLEELAGEMDSFLKVTSSVQPPHCFTSANNSSFVDESRVVGIGIQKTQIVEKLLFKVDMVCLSVIPIVGMAGLGKTTLAQVVYNDDKVRSYFKLRIWVSVSLEFDVVRITRNIIESVTKRSCKLTYLDLLQAELKELLRGKKFLIVFDDVWTEKHSDWEVLSAPLRFGSDGSKVIITTRSRGVSTVVRSDPYLLPLLPDIDCWNLMKQWAILDNNIGRDDNVDAIGLEIAKKCHGLPLVAKILGSTMNCIPFEEWDSILKSDLWDLAQFKDGMFSALALSYHCLPAELKKCFAYCALFPANHMFEEDNLVLLWLAEGLIQPIGERRLECIGRQYFKDLVGRSFFYSDLVEQKVYRMHYFFRQMAQFISTDICLQIEDERPAFDRSPKNIRHLSFCCSNFLPVELKEFRKCKRLRTFLWRCINVTGVGEDICDLLKKFSMLRVLDLSWGGIIKLPRSICKLEHLRYLNLSHNPIKYIPDSVGNLIYLQTLELNNCIELLAFPETLINLENLRHLQFHKCQGIAHMPSKFGELTNLQTLSEFVIGEDEGSTIVELKEMTFLKGSLHLSRLENVKDEVEAQEANLNMKLGLEELELEWTSPKSSNDAEIVLSHIQLHGNLKKLIITRYYGVTFPLRWLNHSPVSKLKTIQLQGCSKCSLLPALGHLQLLESLLIEDMPAVKSVHFEFFQGFPSLKSLEFRNMLELKIWNNWDKLNLRDMPSLHVLTCKDCPSLISLPPLGILRSLTILEIIDCPTLSSLPKVLPVSLLELDVRGSAIVEDQCAQGSEDCLRRALPDLRIVTQTSLMNEPAQPGL